MHRMLLTLGLLLTLLLGCGSHGGHWQHAHGAQYHHTHRTTDAHDTRPAVDRGGAARSPYHQIGAATAAKWERRWRQR